MSDFLETYVRLQSAWSRSTFGAGKRTIGITTHIEKELQEIRADPEDLEEWIDVMILAMDGYWRAGGAPSELAEMLAAKQDKNLSRKWPPMLPEDQPVEHIR